MKLDSRATDVWRILICIFFRDKNEKKKNEAGIDVKIREPHRNNTLGAKNPKERSEKEK